MRRSAIRLLVAIIATALLSVAFNVFESDSLPRSDEIGTLVIGFIFLFVTYGFFVTVLYLVAFSAAKAWKWGWLLFPAIFICLTAGTHYLVLIQYDGYEIAGKSIVVARKLTPLGWGYWGRNAVESAVMAAVATVILFGFQQKNPE